MAAYRGVSELAEEDYLFVSEITRGSSESNP